MNWLDAANMVPADPNDQSWIITGAKVGRVVGIADGDDSLSTMISLHFTCDGLSKPGKFVLTPDDAVRLADALLDSAASAKSELP